MTLAVAQMGVLGMAGRVVGTSPNAGVAAPSGALERVSVSSTGAQGDSHTYQPDVSATGRYVVFASFSTTLVAADTNGAFDVFIRDRQLGTTERVSVTSSGSEANGDSFDPSVSADGRYIAFNSRARNLDARDTSSNDDVYVHDRQTGTTELISVTLSDTGSNQVQTAPTISADGRYVAFTTGGGNIVGGSEPAYGVYVRDRVAGTSELVSVGSAGQPANGFNPSISDDGQHVAFDSGDSGLDPADTNGRPDVFVRDRNLGTTELVSRGPAGESGNGESSYARISSDGRRVAFMSYAFNWGFGRPNPGVYLRDRAARTTFRVDVPPGGTGSNIESGPPDLSGDGRYVVFRSTGTDLAPGPTNGWFETYVADLVGGTMERVSVAADGGVQSPGGSYNNAISTDGSVVVFLSDAANLVANDTNGTVDAFAREYGLSVAITSSPLTAPRFSIFEAAFVLNQPSDNPFDPDQISIDATFTAPSGQQLTVPAFWSQDQTTTFSEQYGVEDYHPVGDPGWHVRFAPAEVGQYEYVVTAHSSTETATSRPRTFTATASSNPGFVRVDPQDPLYLRFDNGTPYTPVGHNAAFEDVQPFQGGTRFYQPLFESFGRARENWTRIWMTNFNRSAIEAAPGDWHNNYQGLGRYALNSAWRMDQILDLAAQHGIQVQLVLNDHGLFREGLNWQWNAYNARSGGPVAEARPWEFFTDPAAREAFKHRLRYLVARYGAYSNVLAWELFNEIQFVGSDQHNPLNDPAVATAVQDWHAEMSAYLRQIDPYHHLITTSSDVQANGLTDPIWREPSMDLVQIHDYHGPFDARNDEMRAYITQLQTTYGKPVIFGEFGSDQECPFDPTTYQGSTAERDHLAEGTFVHNGAWAAAMTASGAMHWWWGCYMAADAASHRSPPNFPLNEAIFPSLVAFMDGEDGGARHMRPAAPTSSVDVRAFAMSDAQHALLWVRDARNERGTGFGPGDLAPTRTVSGATVSLPGMANGPYDVELWTPYGSGGKIGDTLATASGGVLLINVPDFQRDLAFKVSRSPIVPPDAPTGVAAAAGDARASVSWSPPASDGGSAISSYVVTAAPGGQTATVAANLTTATVTGLSNGTSYQFTVAATNGSGTGPPSSPSASVTPQAGAQATTSTVPPAGGTSTTDPGTGPTPSDPTTTSVIVPTTAQGGSVTITEAAVTGAAPTGYQVVGQQVDITSTAGTSGSNPLTIVFTIDASAIRQAFSLGPSDPLPAAAQVEISRVEGTGPPAVVPACTVVTPTLGRDPCVSDRQYINNGDDLRITILTGSASHWNTVARAVTVTVADSGYNPRAVTVAQGGILLWTFGGAKSHSATENLKLGPAKAPLFTSGVLTRGRYGYVFRAAATYTYGSTVKGDPGSFTGSVAVPVLISPTSGGSGTSFTVTWSSSTLTGYVFDVQYRFMKAGSRTWSPLKAWKSGVSNASGAFSPSSGLGTYAFSARLRNRTTGMAALWSPETSIVVR